MSTSETPGWKDLDYKNQSNSALKDIMVWEATLSVWFTIGISGFAFLLNFSRQVTWITLNIWTSGIFFSYLLALHWLRGGSAYV